MFRYLGEGRCFCAPRVRIGPSIEGPLERIEEELALGGGDSTDRTVGDVCRGLDVPPRFSLSRPICLAGPFA